VRHCDQTALDARHRTELLAAIDALRREAATTVVLISRDLPLVAAVADTIVIIDRGRVVEYETGLVTVRAASTADPTAA
jgi:ABC-type glutathione transport system ATPase component